MSEPGAVATGSRVISKAKRGTSFSSTNPKSVATPTRRGSDTKRPNKVRRHAQQHDSKTNGAVQRKLVKQAESYHSAGSDEEQSRERMRGNSKCVAGGRALLAKQKHTCGG